MIPSGGAPIPPTVFVLTMGTVALQMQRITYSHKSIGAEKGVKEKRKYNIIMTKLPIGVLL